MSLSYLTNIIGVRRIGQIAQPCALNLFPWVSKIYKAARLLLSRTRRQRMELFFLILLALMLLAFGYAQLQKGVFKTPGQITSNEEDELEIR